MSYINTLTTQKQDAIVISANDPNAIVPALEKARAAGIKVVTYDSDTDPKGRDLFINQVDPEQIGRTQVQLLAKQIGDAGGDIAILSATPNATNQNTWIEFMKDELSKPEYSKFKLVKTAYGNDDDQKSFEETQGLLQAYPDLKGIISPTTVGIAAAARYLSDSKSKGKVKLTGLGTPNQMREFVKDGTVDGFELWDPGKLGYLAGYAAAALASPARSPAPRARPSRPATWARRTSSPTAWSCSARPRSSTSPTSTTSTSRKPKAARTMERVCFELQVRADRIDEYRERHRAVWPEMLAALSAAGWTNYSLFLRPDGLLIGYVETEDFEAAQRAMERDRRERPLAGRDGAAVRARAHVRAPRGGVPPWVSTPPSTSARRAAAWSAAGSPTASWRSRSATASRTAPCGCRTGCTGTCCTCSPRRSARCAAAARRRRRGHLGRRLRAARRARHRVLGLPFHYRDERTDGRARAWTPTRSPASRRCRSTPSTSCSPDDRVR